MTMSRRVLGATIASAALLTPLAAPVEANLRRTAYADTFAALDARVWTRQAPLCKSAANVTVSGGMLRLASKPARQHPDGCPVVGARVDTFGRASFGPGTITTRIRFAPAEGSWQTFWMTGASGKTFPLNGEIDVAEVLGRARHLLPMRVHTAYRDLRKARDGSLRKCTSAREVHADMSRWHTIAVSYGADAVTITNDGRQVWRLTRAQHQRKGCTWPFADPGNGMRPIIDAGIGHEKPYAGVADPSDYPRTVLVDTFDYRPGAR